MGVKTCFSTHGTAYTLTGKSGAPTIVLIHGLGLTRDTWMDYMAALEAQFQVLSYDLLGHGESPPAPESLDLAAFARQIVELMDELKISRGHLLGFSLGGMINRRFAMDFPDRAASLIILNSPHERGEEAQKLVEERAAATDSGGPGATIDATIARWFTPGYRLSNDDRIEPIRQWVLANDPTSYTRSRWVLANGVIELIRPQPGIIHPALVITCENDSGSTPAMSHAIASEIPGAKTIIIPDLQHMGLVEQPQLFLNPIFEFLGSIDAASPGDISHEKTVRWSGRC